MSETALQKNCSLDGAHAASAVVLAYDILLNRNPCAEEFQQGMQFLEDGGTADSFFRWLACSDEAFQRFMANPNFEFLVERLLGEKSPELMHEDLAWKAENRPLSYDAPPGVMQIELTNKCPFRCVMCPRTLDMTRPKGIMTFDLFAKVIDELVTLHPDYARTQPPIWLHHFGESLVHPEFPKFIAYAKAKGVPTAMSINPLMLTPPIAEKLLEAEPAALYLSLDGHDDESFEKIRGVPKAYEKSSQRLLAFLEQKVARKRQIHMTLSVIDFALNGDRDDVERQRLEAYWRGIAGLDAFMWKPFDTFSGELDYINDLSGASQGVKLVRQYRDQFKVTCDFPWRRVVIAWDGRVLPCCHDYDAKLTLGNLQEQSLMAIWNGERMQRLRREFMSGKVTNPVCMHCEHRYKNNPRTEVR